jgi:hypothetical protein
VKVFINPSESKQLTRGNTLVYLLWATGVLGALVTVVGWPSNPIANRDFVSFWVAGKLAIRGQATLAYDTSSLRAAAGTLAGTTYPIAYPYPPQFFFVAVPLSWLPLVAAFVAWLFITGATFCIAAKPYVPRNFPLILALVTPAAICNLAFGQTGFLYGALWLFAFEGSAVAAALLTVKPHLGLLVAAEAGRRGQLIRTSVIVLAITALSALVFGIDSWRACLMGLKTNHLQWVQSGRYGGWLYQMTTPYIGYGLAGWLAFAVAALALLVRRFDAFTSATAAFLVAPYGFHYDMTVICLGFGLTLFRYWRSMPPLHTAVCACGFLSPLVVAAGTWLVPPILLAGLFVMATVPRGEIVEIAADH